MATKIDYFYLNDNPKSVTVDNSKTVHDNQYANLNLNQNLKFSDVSPTQSKSKSYNNKNCGTAAILKLPGSSVSDNIEGRENPLHLIKPSKISDFSNLINDKTENVESKKPWRKNSYSNTINSSTISLHIAAFENSAKTDSFNGSKNEDFQNGESDSLKNEKQIFTVGTFVIQNSFEFPRQENEGFKAGLSGIPDRVPEIRNSGRFLRSGFRVPDSGFFVFQNATNATPEINMLAISSNSHNQNAKNLTIGRFAASLNDSMLGSSENVALVKKNANALAHLFTEKRKQQFAPQNANQQSLKSSSGMAPSASQHHKLSTVKNCNLLPPHSASRNGTANDEVPGQNCDSDNDSLPSPPAFLKKFK